MGGGGVEGGEDRPRAGQEPVSRSSGGPEEDPASRVLERAELVRRHGRPREGRLVFTNGCFDLLHRGHASLLYRARALGDVLVVGLNSDASVRRLKGPGRPLLPERDRAWLLASLRPVDAVTVFGEDTPLELIRALRPDVLVKGADYEPDEVVGGSEVEADGGEVRLLPLEPGRSTSRLVARLREAAEGVGDADAPGSR